MMLLLFVIILMVVGLAIIGTLYSLFVPFFQQLGDIKQYNMAYYGAVSSVERGMLSLRYHGPGFEAESGFKNGQPLGNATDTTDDLGRLSDPKSEMDWSVKSRTQIIPTKGQGNVPYALKGDKSENYLVLGYSDLMEYNLDMDNSTSPYKSETKVSRSDKLSTIQLWARLPQKLYEEYGKAPLPLSCDDLRRCDDIDEDRIPNDLVVDWSMEGKNGENSFRIVPRVDVDYATGNWSKMVRRYDTLIRESHINTTTSSNSTKLTAQWGDQYQKNPISNYPSEQPPIQNMIGGNINMLSKSTFQSLFSAGNVTDLKLLLGLARELKTKDGKMYPFLETKIKVNDNAEIPDLFYHLNGHAKVGDYDVTLNVKKPTSDRSLLGSFTIVF